MSSITYLGRTNNYISGLTSLAAGGVGILQLPTNRRYHRLNFTASAIAYQSPTVVFGSSTGVTALGTVQVVNGTVAGVTVTNAGTAYTVAPSVTITDSLYTTASGQTLRVGTGATATASIGTGTTVLSVTITNGGTATPTPPELVISQIKQLVNGVNMRDIQVSSMMKLIAANPFSAPINGVANNLQPGEMPLYYTEPWRNLLQHNETTSWDLTGQGTFELDFIVNSGISSPSLVGSYEFDYRRNARPDGKGNMVAFLNPISHHQYSFPIPGGQYDITFLPVKYPILRMWVILNSAAGVLNYIELLAVGNKLVEQTSQENQQTLNEYGFNTSIFSTAFVFDPDQRAYKALGFSSDSVPGDMILRLNTASAGVATVIMECLPGAFR